MRPHLAPEARWTPGDSVHVRTRGELDAMRAAGRAAAETLSAVAEMIRPGVSTMEVNDFVLLDTRARGGTCATFGYKGYPLHCCTSVNEVACHGLPGRYRLTEGDIVNVDVTTVVDGWHGDTSATFYVTSRPEATRLRFSAVHQAMRSGLTGISSELAAEAACVMMDVDKPLLDRMRVVEACKLAFDAALAQVRPGNRLGNVGAAVQAVASALGMSVVDAFAGHGIGRGFHEAPVVQHTGKAGTGMRLRPGMTFTVEPILALGEPAVDVLGDGWTAVTRDGSPTAQFEHTVAVTDDGCEILTQRRGPLPNCEV